MFWHSNTHENSELLQLKGQIDALHRVQAVIEFDLEGSILTANDNFLNAMGYSLSEIKGQHHRLFVDSEYARSSDYKAFWQRLGQGKFDSGEYKRLAKGGKEIWIQASYNPVFDENNKPVKVIKFATDITKQKLQTADFAGQIDAISKSQAVIEFNMDGTIITANDNFLNAVGYSLDEVKGQHHSMFAEPEYANGSEYQQFWQQLNKGKFDAGEYKRLGKGGKEIWIQASYNPIFDMNGKPFKVVKYATDITMRKLAIEDIKSVILAMTEGDLSQTITKNYGEEFSVLTQSMNSLLTKLSNLVEEISAASDSVFNTSSELATGNKELSHRTESQASSLEETASAMEELAATIQQNASNA